MKIQNRNGVHFSIVGVLIALWRCRLQTDNLDKLVLLVKNWPFDPRQDLTAISMTNLQDFETKEK